MKQRISQVLFTIIQNIYLRGFLIGGIYQGKLKSICSPGLNCYSCPAAIVSCPIGVIQHFMGYGAYHISFYTLGFIGIIGSVGGRVVCGWACPFGLLKDLLYKIKVPKIEIPGWCTHLRYVIIFIMVFLVPFLTQEYWFCKICPQGTLEAGIPLVTLNPELQQLVGPMFFFKIALLLIFLLGMCFTKRPFCRIFCPLGTFYSFFNRFSMLRISCDQQKCDQCDQCYQNCPVSLKVYQGGGNTSHCIRCLSCTNCPKDAVKYEIKLGFG